MQSIRWKALCVLATLLTLTGCGKPECQTDADCNDNNACTTEVCRQDVCVRDAVAVDDSNRCTADACDPSTGAVSHTPVSVDDSNVCTTDSCEPTTGVHHEPIAMDDGNACTTDSCDPSTGVHHTPVALTDNNLCTMDACDPATGVSHVAISTDDSNVCTADSCDPATGVHHDAESVDDGNACTADACDPSTGVSHTPVAVDDSNACTTDACNPATGVSHTPVSTDDSNACTTDSCEPSTGAISHTAVSVDDSNVCTTDSCDPATGVRHDPIAMDDGIACTTDACDPATGVSHTPVHTRCELDGFSCTVAVCSPSTGCSESADDARCSDGAACTADSCMGAGGATGTGCRNAPNDTLCQPLQVCGAGGCTAATSGDQVGNIVITEFSALGSEFIELHNTSALAVDVHGFVFQNLAGQLADIRAATDVDGSAGTSVTLPAGGYIYGVANPLSGTLPAGAAFVYGDAGTSFSLNDTGDVLAIHSRNGATLQDYVDFRTFITDADAQMAANAFPGFLGVSTQVDPASASATGNDSGNGWCTTFAKVKVSNTAGAPNGGCKLAVINEVLIDPSGADDGKGFVEIVGPGGALVGGAKVEDVEGKSTTAGARNSELTLTAGWRIPADGILVIADGVNGATGTFTPSLVPGLGAGDLTVRDIDLENSGGDAVILVAPDGTVWDAVGYDPAGNALDKSQTTFTINGSALTMYEGGQTAITPTDNVGYSLCRDALSTDSDNNRNDFRVCLNPSPGQVNSVGTTTLTSLSPNNTLASASSTSNVVLTGTGFGSGVTVKFGAANATCALNSTTQLTCTAPANSTVGRVDVTVTNTLRSGSGIATATQAFTYTGVLNGTANPQQADFCNLQYPGAFTAAPSTATPLIYGRLYEAGLTEASGAPSGVTAQVGYGPSASNPTTVTTWRYVDAAYNVQVGNDDEYQASFIAPATAGTYSYAYRFSSDNGLTWTYCDQDGAGSTGGASSFSTAQLGTLTVQ